MIIFIDLIMVLEAMLADSQPCEKLQCSHENLKSKISVNWLFSVVDPDPVGGGAVLGIHWCKYATDLV